jgi:hypothetical protein
VNERQKSIAALVFALLAAIGGAIMSAGTWLDVASPQGVGGIFLAAGGAFGGWMAKPWGQASREDR